MKKVSNAKKKNGFKLNRTGFTLVELLAVIAILSTVSVVVMYTATNLIANAKEKSYQVSISNIEKEAGAYALENQSGISWQNVGIGEDKQYYCISVQNLIDTGYFNSDVLESEIASGELVQPNDYIYLERDTGTKTVTKNVLLAGEATSYSDLCSDMKSSGIISYKVEPLGWSRYKDIIITYKLLNKKDSLDKYRYYYDYTSDSSIVNDSENIFKSNTYEKTVRVEKNGTLNSKIMYDGDTIPIATNSLNVSKIDLSGPEISVSIVDGTTYSKSKDALIKLVDNESGFKVGNYKLYYEWSTSNMTCDQIKNSSTSKSVNFTIGTDNLNSTKEEKITISGKSGAGKLYICGEGITDYVGNSLKESLVSSEMYLDNTRPKIELGDYKGASEVQSEVTIPLEVTDTYSGVDSSSFTSTDVIVTVGDSTLDTGVITVTKEDDNNYNLVISNSTKNGKITISIGDSGVLDNAGNGNEPFSKELGIEFNNTYMINYYTYDGKTKIGSSIHTYDVAKKLTTMTDLGGTAPSSNVTFYGWATSANSTTMVYSDGQSVTNLATNLNEDVNLYAIWRSSAVNITYKSGINKATTEGSRSYYYYNGDTSVSIKTAMPAEISDWTVLGWRTDTTADDKEYSSDTEEEFSTSTTLYAVYSRSYVATFYSGVNKKTTKNVTSNTAYYNSNDSSTPTTVSVTTPTVADSEDITNWTELGYRNDTDASSEEYDYDKLVTVDWGTNFYATYSRTLTISYNGNGETSGSTTATTTTVYLNSNSTTTSSQSLKLASNGFAKTGNKFNKWAEGSVTGIQYSAKATYDPSLTYDASTFGETMYALWNVNSYVVSLDANGGSVTPTSVSVTYGSKYGTLPTPQRTGYDFDGWYTAKTDGTVVTSDTVMNTASNHTLYAHWDAITYTVTYNANGCGTAPNSVTKTYGVDLTLTTMKSLNTGYTFLGWATSSSASSVAYGPTGTYSTNDSVTLYAVCKQTLSKYVTDLYTNATKTAVTNNSIEYNYATDKNLMNDRLGSSSIGKNAGNVRYYGANPNNYIKFNCDSYPGTTCETWRIIGVFTVDGVKRVKIIRSSPLEDGDEDVYLVWDNRNVGTDFICRNGGTYYGTNDWTKSRLMMTLNPSNYYKKDYSSATAGSYWYRKSGNCYADTYSNSLTECDFSTTGIKGTTTKNKISTSTWDIGGIYVDESQNLYLHKNGFADYFYNGDHGDESRWNETTWEGRIGLMYASDFAYGMDFTKCSQSPRYFGTASSCYDNDWLLNREYNIGTMSHQSNNGVHTFTQYGGTGYGYFSLNCVGLPKAIYPTLYLDEDVYRVGGTGTSSNPYTINMG